MPSNWTKPLDTTLTGTSTSDQSGPGSNGNEGVILLEPHRQVQCSGFANNLTWEIQLVNTYNNNNNNNNNHDQAYWESKKNQ